MNNLPPSLHPESLMTHIQALCQGIGPRPSASEKERRAADYVEKTARQFGITDIERQLFKSPNSAGLVTVPAFAAGLLGVALAIFGGLLGKLLGGILLIVSAFVFRQSILVEPTFFEKLISRWNSQNVIAKISAASGKPRKTMYLVGHLDSQKQRFQFPPSPHWITKTQTSLPIVVGLLGGLALLLELALGNVLPSWWLWIVGAGFLYGFIGALYDEFQPHVEGANDNATAVSVLLGVGAALKSQPLENTDVVLLFTGCEEVGCAGMENYLKQYAPPKENTFWVDVEMVGTGNLCYVTKHGISYLSAYYPHPHMVKLADQTAREHPDLKVTGKDMVIIEEIANLWRRGYKSVCVAGYNAEGVLPNWHRLSDTLENIEPETLSRAAHYVWELAREIDRA